MAISSKDYDKELKKLVQQLDIEQAVHFLGYQNREDIINNHKNSIFVSPSLHSDENFGMAALMMIKNGHRAVLSQWGGHHNYKVFDQVHFCRVYMSENGPFIRVEELVDKMNKALSCKTFDQSDDPFYFEKSQLKVRNILDKIEMTKSQSQKLKKTSFFDKLLEKRSEYKRQKYQQKIFNDYDDELYHKFCFAYGGMNSFANESFAYNHYLPWVETSHDLIICDPIKGEYRLDKDKARLYGVSYPKVGD